MRPRLPAISRRRLVLVVAIAALGFGAWFVFVHERGEDDGVSARTAGGTDATVPAGPAPAGGLSVAEQAEQVLLLGFDGIDPAAEFVQSLGQRQLGGVLIRSQNWGGAAAGAALADGISKAGSGEGRVAPLIATAQEGGIYRSLGDLPPQERALDIGREGSRQAAREWATATATGLAEAGIDLNLFPVADVASLDSPLAGRAFSDDPSTVAALTVAALEGCAEAKIACAPAHFPGLGAASADTSSGPATVSLDPETLGGRDLAPFRAARKLAPAIVVSLGLYAAYDAVVPAALAPEVTTGLLRDDLNFKGLAIADDLSAGAVQGSYESGEAAVAALNAGIDLIQISEPADQGGVAVAIEQAVRSGELPPERLEQAVERVLRLKRKLGIGA